MVPEELKASSVYNPVKYERVGTKNVYFLQKYKVHNVLWRVEWKTVSMVMKCSCIGFESIGLPCAHMFQVIQMEYMSKIPDSCLLNRWKRYAKTEKHYGRSRDSVVDQLTPKARYGDLASNCDALCYHAYHTRDGYDRIKMLVQRETNGLKNELKSKCDGVVGNANNYWDLVF